MKRSIFFSLSVILFLTISIGNKSMSNRYITKKSKSIFHKKNENNTKQDSTFADFLSYFQEKTVPYSFSYLEQCNNSPLPKRYSNILNNSGDKIIPIAKINIRDKYIGVFFGDENTDHPCYRYFFIYDKKGDFIDQWTISDDDLYRNEEEYTIFVMDQFFNIFIEDAFLGRTQTWIYDDDTKTATFMSGRTNFVYTNLEELSIQNNGEIEYDIAALDTVENFLNYLGQDKKQAFKLEKIATWGSFYKFSSLKSFGGVSFVNIDSISVQKETENKAEIYCNADYIDKINGNSHIKQLFYLSKTGGKWFISDMKILHFEKYADYLCKNFNFGQLSLSNIKNKGFDFDLLVVSSLPDNEDEKYAGEIISSAKYLTPSHAIFRDGKAQLDFYFSGKNQVEVTEKNCNIYRNKNIKFNGIFKANF